MWPAKPQYLLLALYQKQIKIADPWHILSFIPIKWHWRYINEQKEKMGATTDILSKLYSILQDSTWMEKREQVRESRPAG